MLHPVCHLFVTWSVAGGAGGSLTSTVGTAPECRPELHPGEAFHITCIKKSLFLLLLSEQKENKREQSEMHPRFYRQQAQEGTPCLFLYQL